MTGAKILRCISCGSTKIMRSGLISFVWSRGQWRPKLDTAEMADTPHVYCGDCGTVMRCPDTNNPANGLGPETTG